jgi:hypothetical protein
MESYILGYYAPSDPVLDDTFANEKNREIIKVLVGSYPTPLNYKQIASKGKLKEKTVYGKTYLPELEARGFVREVEGLEEKGGGSLAAKFVIENVNSLSRLRCPEYSKYSIAPGNVVYSEGFKSALDSLINELDIKDISRALSGFVKYIVENVKRIDDEHTKKIAPKKDPDYICSSCGLNHEARDFIRATLLYLLDQFEISSGYLEFLREQDYINQVRYHEYSEKLGNRESGVIKTESRLIHSKTDEEEIVAQATDHKQLMTEGQSPIKERKKQMRAKRWFERLDRLTNVKEIFDFILSSKREISKEYLMDLIEDCKRKNHSRSDVVAIAAVAEHLRVTLTDQHVDLINYREKKQKERYDRKKRSQSNVGDA